MFNNFSSVFVIRSSGLVLAAFSNFLAVKLLGAESFGDAIIVVSIVNICLIVSVGGSQRLLTRTIARQKTEDGEGKGGKLSIALCFSFVSLCISMGIALTLISLYRLSLFTVCLLLILLVFQTLKAIGRGYLLGCSKTVFADFLEYLLRPVLIISMLIFLWIFPYLSLDSKLYVCVLVLISFILSSLIAMHIRPVRLRMASKNEVVDWFHSAKPFVFMSAALVIQNNLDILMVGYFLNSEEVGVYALAVRIATTVAIGASASNTVVAPLISKRWSKMDIKGLQSIVFKASIFGFGVSLILVILILSQSSLILNFIGEEFVRGSFALNLLMIGVLFSAFCGPVGVILTMTEHAARASFVIAVATALNAILNFILIPLYGIEGAAVATLVSMSVWNIVLLYFCYAKLNVVSGFLSIVRFKQSS